MLIHLYSSYIDSNSSSNNPAAKTKNNKLADNNKNGRRSYSDNPLPNGHARAPHAASGGGAERQLRDEQEFELEALISDDEDEPLKSNGRPR